ncbi:hypothetical protein ACFP56_19150 [Paenibacillus septentrionalis]|uniref:Uncharacterized protein n=1 Tax=Paenibacillus septentrionalis TaxID=429342 RepID=A0ABW1V7Z2_9BACL
MYPASPSIKNNSGKGSVKIEKLSMIPVELLKQQEALRIVPVK